jgi:hypothetical protein
MKSDASRNALLALGLFFGTVLLIAFLMALIRTNAAEAAAALGGVIGGVIGASGAAVAVYLTLVAQRQEDRTRIRSAVVREVIEFSRVAVGHLQTCENIAAGLIALPAPRLADAMKMPVPIIYPAIEDRIGLLLSPQNVVAFYSRVVEITMIMVPAIASDPKLQAATLKKTTSACWSKHGSTFSYLPAE